MSDTLHHTHDRPPATAGVKVVYKYIDGAHFFTSADPMSEGLCAASTNLEVAYNEVQVQLALLYKHNHNIETQFEPPLPYEIFKNYIESAIGEAENYINRGLIVPSSIQPWMMRGDKNL